MDPIGEGAAQTFEPFVTYLQARKPDVVFVAGTDASGLAFLKRSAPSAARRRPHRRRRLERAERATRCARRASSSACRSRREDPRPEAQQFVRAFEAKFHMSPDNNAALAYDATQLVYQASQAVGTDRREDPRLPRRPDPGDGAIHGVTGAISFLPDR